MNFWECNDVMEGTPKLTEKQKKLAISRSGYPKPLLRKVEEEVEKFS